MGFLKTNLTNKVIFFKFNNYFILISSFMQSPCSFINRCMDFADVFMVIISMLAALKVWI